MTHLVNQLTQLAVSTVAALGGEKLVRESNVRADEVWAVGKAACAMARGSGIARGIVITKHAEPMDLEVYEAGHPFPDERGVAATLRLLARAKGMPDGARVLLCLSGGASALLAAPVDGVTLAMLRRATVALLHGGAPIGEINVVRRHLGAALGGKLALATRAELQVLALSDVVGDDAAAIGSGPASPDPSTLEDALGVARRYALDEEILHALAQAPETAKETHARFRILASPLSLRDEAARQARDFSVRLRPQLVTGPVEAIAEEIASLQLAPGELWIAAGEPTVKVGGSGVGGRAQHLALLVARRIAQTDLAFVALGSDGSDGPTPAAGAAVDGTTWSPGAAEALANFDSHHFLTRAGATLVTGPTGTNLTDLLLLARGA